VAELYGPEGLHDILTKQLGYAPHYAEGTPHRKEIQSFDTHYRKFIRFYLKQEYANVKGITTRQVGAVVAIVEMEVGGGHTTSMLMKSCEPQDLGDLIL
jgi:hypothetical protein